MKSMIFVPPFEHDLAKARNFYLAIDRKLADRFSLAIDRILTTIQNQPYLYGRIQTNFRAAPIRKFPYVVIYTVHRTMIRVISVHHVRKGSFSWLS